MGGDLGNFPPPKRRDAKGCEAIQLAVGMRWPSKNNCGGKNVSIAIQQLRHGDQLLMSIF
jgi:hypothetical protein